MRIVVFVFVGCFLFLICECVWFIVFVVYCGVRELVGDVIDSFCVFFMDYDIVYWFNFLIWVYGFCLVCCYCVCCCGEVVSKKVVRGVSGLSLVC